jgi:GTP-binding protein LepA
MNIRNFSILSHIDHGKSTLADRILEICQAVPKEKMREQFLDKLELERERGITIKAKAVRLNHSLNATSYVLNLIDTPGHVDFSYEVSKTLKACEGAILLVDATKGIQAQTLANFYLAREEGLTIVPTVNKIDLPQAQPEKVAQDISQSLGFSQDEILLISAKVGTGVPQLLEKIIKKIPPPNLKTDFPLRALIFDSSFDPYEGVVVFVRIFDGKVTRGGKIKFFSNGRIGRVLELGYLTPEEKTVEMLSAGEVGFIATDLKEISAAQIGDTVTLERETASPISGFRKFKSLVFFSFYPADPAQYAKLKDALEKIKLSDYALTLNPQSSSALGQGFRIGFLGLLHAEIIQERIEREYGVSVVATSPQVPFILDGKVISKPQELPAGQTQILEPQALVSVFTPQIYLGQILDFLHNKKAQELKREYLAGQVHLEVEMPLSSVMIDFYEPLKSISQGFASFDFEESQPRPAKVERLDILVNKIPVDALSQIVHQDEAYQIGKKLVGRLKTIIPRQQFEVAIQAAIGLPARAYGSGRWQTGGKIIATERIPPYRKDVTGYLYGGDVTRKMKLLGKQKKGKKRLKQIGKVQIPQEAFLAVLKSD